MEHPYILRFCNTLGPRSNVQESRLSGLRPKKQCPEE